jgi:hypothetical protein
MVKIKGLNYEKVEKTGYKAKTVEDVKNNLLVSINKWQADRSFTGRNSLEKVRRDGKIALRLFYGTSNLLLNADESVVVSSADEAKSAWSSIRSAVENDEFDEAIQSRLDSMRKQMTKAQSARKKTKKK